MKKLGKFSNVHQIVEYIINMHVKEDFICVDGTLGNGFDSLKILSKLSNKGTLYSFDIQKEAILKSEKLINSASLRNKNYHLICDSHENVREYVKETIDFFILNLGYLPGGDKSITTDYNSVSKFLKNIKYITNEGGVGIIVFYPGHESGKIELDNISEILTNYDQKCYNILEIKFINQKNNPPQIILIERIL